MRFLVCRRTQCFYIQGWNDHNTWHLFLVTNSLQRRFSSQADSCCIRSLYVILSRTGLLLHLVAVSNSATVCYLSLYTINEQFNGPWTNEKHWKVLRWFKLLSGFIFISPQNYCHVSMSFQNSTHKQNVTRLSITTFFSSGIGLFYDFQMSVTDCWICVITSQ